MTAAKPAVNYIRMGTDKQEDSPALQRRIWRELGRTHEANHSGLETSLLEWRTYGRNHGEALSLDGIIFARLLRSEGADKRGYLSQAIQVGTGDDPGCAESC